MHPEFVVETSDALRRVKTNESRIILGDFTAHVGNHAAGVWAGVIGKHVGADVNDNIVLLLQLCCNHALCIISSLF